MTTQEHAGVSAGVRRRSAWAGWAIASGALVLVIAGASGWRLTRGATEFGAGTAVGAVPARPAPSHAVGAAGGMLPDVPVADGGLPGPAAIAVVRLAIPAAGVDAPVKPVGLDRTTGAVAIPSDVDVLGWYRFGPGWGSSAGSVVIIGHVDGAGQGRGAFYPLREVRAGARVIVTAAGGRTRVFIVVAREVFAKTSLPVDGLFARQGPLRLTLITCGGRFDPKAQRYSDNVVLTAVPA